VPAKPPQERPAETTPPQSSRDGAEDVAVSLTPFQKNGLGDSAHQLGLEIDIRRFRAQRLPVGTVIGLTLVTFGNLIPVFLAILQGYVGPWLTIIVATTLLEISAISLLIIFPDWCSLKTTGNVFGMAAALFGMAATFLAFASEARLQALAITTDLQDAAARWMISLMAIQATTAFFCFKSAETWRRRTSAILVGRRRR